MRSGFGRTAAIMLAAAVLLLAGGALGESTEIILPDGQHRLTLPEGMEYQEPAEDEKDLKGIFLMPPDLEMLVFAYDAGQATVQDLAETMTNAGLNAQLREVGGETMLVFQDQDPADQAPCLGYSYVKDGIMVEISFFYSSQGAMDLTESIMESIHQ